MNYLKFFLVFMLYECLTASAVAKPTEYNSFSAVPNRMGMPLVDLGYKQFYLGMFFKANWFRASQFCRFHGMDLASITNQEEQEKLEAHIRLYGLMNEQIWLSGNDLAEEGSFFWMGNGQPLTYTNWISNQPNNYLGSENCLEMWGSSEYGLKWNDRSCSHKSYFVCEI